MNERAAKALADMDRAIGILERLTAPKSEAWRVKEPPPKQAPVVILAREIER